MSPGHSGHPQPVWATLRPGPGGCRVAMWHHSPDPRSAGLMMAFASESGPRLSVAMLPGPAATLLDHSGDCGICELQAPAGWLGWLQT